MDNKFEKLNKKVEQTLAFGGVDLLEKPVLVNAVVVIAIATDFSVFYTIFSGINDFFSGLIMAASCAGIIDTVPLVTARCINNLCSSNLSRGQRGWNQFVLIASIVAFLMFFGFTAMVRWQSGASMFELGISTSGQATGVTLENLKSSEKAMLLFTCVLPLFTSIGVLLVGLFVDGKAQRRKMLRSQRNALLANRAALAAAKMDLESALQLDLNASDESLYQDMNDYVDELCLALRVYFRTALAERLKTPDDLTHLSRSALATAEARIVHLAEAGLQELAVVGETTKL